MKRLASIFILLLLVGTASATHVQEKNDRSVSFEHKNGNEWWVEVVLDGADASSVDRVHAKDEGGRWVELEKKDWGAWAASFHIEPGNDVRFRATWGDDRIKSCWFSHPDGVEKCSRDDDRLGASTFVGTGQERTRGWDVVADAEGNAYVALASMDERFFTSDALIAKYDSDASLEWMHRFPGSEGELATNIALDDAGNVFVGGQTKSTDFPATRGQKEHAGNFDSFVAKLDPDGNLLWSIFIGGSDEDLLRGLVIDEGDVWIAGSTASCDFPVTDDALQAEPPGDCTSIHEGNGYVTRLSGDGRKVIYSTYIGGTGGDGVDGLDVEQGLAAVAMEVESSDMPVTANAYQATYAGDHDAYLAILSPQGLEYATYLGGSSEDWGRGVAWNGQGAAILSGYSHSPEYPTTSGAVQPDHGGGECESPEATPPPEPPKMWPCADIVLTSIDRDGNVVFSTFFGDDGMNEAEGVSVDSEDRIHVTGRASSMPGEEEPIGTAGASTYLLTVNPDGSEAERVVRIGGERSDWGQRTFADSGAVWIAGWTWSPEFPTTPGAEQRQLKEDLAGFMLRLDEQGHDPGSVSFNSRNGNEWWVQVHVSDAEPPRVQAQDTGDPWKELELKDWGDWARSFHVEPGNDVRYRAMVDGEWVVSCWFTHPEGKAPDGSETCTAGSDEPASGDFDASFDTPGGNEWWVEVYADANEPIAGVDARANGGDWVALEKKDWGAWAKSFYVEDGSIVEFRATSSDGDTDISDGYRWPSGEKS